MSPLIIDAHIHLYRTREIALKSYVGEEKRTYAGTWEEFLPFMEEFAISRAVLMSLVPPQVMRDAHLARLPQNLSRQQQEQEEAAFWDRMAERIERANDWACALARENPAIVPFIFVDPFMNERGVKEYIRGLASQGARGIKLHPLEQRLYPGERRLWPIYEAAQDMGLPIAFHSGRSEWDRGPGGDFPYPKHFAPVLEAFPRLTVVLAHLGADLWEEVEGLARRFSNVCFDLCGVINDPGEEPRISDEALVRLLRRIGVERVMWASDFPYRGVREGIERMHRLGLSAEEKQLIWGENARRIYRLPG